MANIIKETFVVHGMSCTGCEAVIEETLMALDGITSVRASFAKNLVTVNYDPGHIKFGKMRATLKKASYSIEKATDKISIKPASDGDKPISAAQFIGVAVIL